MYFGKVLKITDFKYKMTELTYMKIKENRRICENHPFIYLYVKINYFQNIHILYQHGF